MEQTSPTAATAGLAGAATSSAPAQSPQIETLTAQLRSTAPEPAKSFRDLALRAGNYLVEDLHIKGPVVLAGLVMAYGYLVNPSALDACKAYAGWLTIFATGGAVAPKRQ